MSKVTLIWAQGKDRVIGNEGAIPWRIPQDMEFFKEQTMGGAVIMGRKTWESIPAKFRPLPGRVNIVLTNQMGYQAPGALVVHTVKRALDVAEHNPRTFIIGGDHVYRQFMWYAEQLIITEVDYEVPVVGDAYAPPLDYKEWGLTRETYWNEVDPALGLRYRHLFYERLARLPS